MSKAVKCRNITIGGDAPISIQSMLNSDPHDKEACIKQIRELEEVGCEIIRLTVPDEEAAKVFAEIRKETDTPLVADIHFDYRMAIAAIEAGADKIRINPGNIGSRDRVLKVVEAAKAKEIPIRIGVNSGSLEKDIIAKYGGVTAEGLAESALRNIKLIEDMGYDNLVVSLKSSDVKMNYDAHKIVATKTEHPIHIGITEAGTLKQGMLKSAVGLGSLLLDGVGDTMRVSLTADPVEEVIFAKRLLETCGLREPAYTLVSCPTCGRTKIDLQSLAEEIDRRLSEENFPKGLKVAVMGCVVNGPGEAAEADYGVAGGHGKGVIFQKGQVLMTVEEEEIADKLIEVIKLHEGSNK